MSILHTYLFKGINKHVQQVRHVHVHLNGSSIVDVLAYAHIHMYMNNSHMQTQ